MRKGMQFTLLILPAALLMGWGSALRAQEGQTATPQAKPDVKPAVTVPPEVKEKARTYKGSPTPPKKLNLEADGHWTPYTPPGKPPEDTEVYTIQKGDTLSVLAQQKLGTWLLWPQIWDQNPYIKDAHWIYPGDPLFFSKPKVVSEAGPIEPQAEAPKAKPEEMQLEQEAPEPPVNANDIYCSGFITKDFHPSHLTIVSSPSEHQSLAKGDVVYLNEGKAEGIESGMVFQALYAGWKVYHPVTGKYIGQFIRKLGQVKVIAVQAHASIAEISQSCDEIVAGVPLVPWKAIPIPWGIAAAGPVPLQLEPSNKPLGRVIWTQDRLDAVGQNSVMFIDLGSKSELLPGDRVWIFRYPAQQANLTQTVNDLYRQQKMSGGPKDLYRRPKPPKSTAPEAAQPDERQGSVPAATASAAQADERQGNVPAATSSAAQPGQGQEAGPPETDQPSHAWADVDAPAQEGVKYVRQYIGEGVVLTTENHTSCVKILSSNVEVALGDWIQVQ